MFHSTPLYSILFYFIPLILKYPLVPYELLISFFPGGANRVKVFRSFQKKKTKKREPDPDSEHSSVKAP